MFTTGSTTHDNTTMGAAPSGAGAVAGVLSGAVAALSLASVGSESTSSQGGAGAGSTGAGGELHGESFPDMDGVRAFWQQNGRNDLTARLGPDTVVRFVIKDGRFWIWVNAHLSAKSIPAQMGSIFPTDDLGVPEGETISEEEAAKRRAWISNSLAKRFPKAFIVLFGDFNAQVETAPNGTLVAVLSKDKDEKTGVYPFQWAAPHEYHGRIVTSFSDICSTLKMRVGSPQVAKHGEESGAPIDGALVLLPVDYDGPVPTVTVDTFLGGRKITQNELTTVDCHPSDHAEVRFEVTFADGTSISGATLNCLGESVRTGKLSVPLNWMEFANAGFFTPDAQTAIRRHVDELPELNGLSGRKFAEKKVLGTALRKEPVQNTHPAPPGLNEYLGTRADIPEEQKGVVFQYAALCNSTYAEQRAAVASDENGVMADYLNAYHQRLCADEILGPLFMQLFIEKALAALGSPVTFEKIVYPVLKSETRPDFYGLQEINSNMLRDIRAREEEITKAGYSTEFNQDQDTKTVGVMFIRRDTVEVLRETA